MPEDTPRDRTVAYDRRNEDRDRVIFSLFQTCPMTEIARRLGISVDAVIRVVYRGRYVARRTVARLIRSGDLTPASVCGACGAIGPTDAHHPDYSKPTEVVWLCHSCHMREPKHRSGPYATKTRQPYPCRVCGELIHPARYGRHTKVYCSPHCRREHFQSTRGLPVGIRRCAACGQALPVDRFGRVTRNGKEYVASSCKQCAAAKARNRYRARKA